jgi:predicted DNA-binding protein (MmcQ/YjbR family)
MPFGDGVWVSKIDKKMFALLSINEPLDFVNHKCDPDQAFILRDIFAGVKPGYPMNKKHWNSVYLDGSVPRGEIERMLDHSYAREVQSLSKKRRTAVEIIHGPERLYGLQRGDR